MSQDQQSTEPRGRVAVFYYDEPMAADPASHVYAIPGHWDDDDIERFVQNEARRWIRVVVMNVEPVPAEYL